MIDLSKTWIYFNCPNCNYEDSVQLIEIKLESRISCHNCKTITILKDNEASVHLSSKRIEQELNNLESIFKKIGK